VQERLARLLKALAGKDEMLQKLDVTTTSVEDRIARVLKELQKFEDTIEDLDYECRQLVEVLPGVTELMKGYV